MKVEYIRLKYWAIKKMIHNILIWKEYLLKISSSPSSFFYIIIDICIEYIYVDDVYGEFGFDSGEVALETAITSKEGSSRENSSIINHWMREEI